MTITIEAIYANGAFRPKVPVNLAEGAQVEITVQIANQTEDPFEAAIGSCDGPADGAANHDKYLYGDSHS